MAGYVYILQSLKNSRYYIGSTDDLTRRMQEHTNGLTPSTRQIRPLKLVFSQQYNSLLEARKIERKLKKYKSRLIIEKIVSDGYIRYVRAVRWTSDRSEIRVLSGPQLLLSFWSGNPDLIGATTTIESLHK